MSAGGRVRITPHTCSGTGLCAFYAADTFDLDDDGRVRLLAAGGDTAGDAAGGDTLDDVRNAAEACPTRSISVTTADTNA